MIFTSIKPLLILGTVSQVGDVAHRLAYLDLHFDRFFAHYAFFTDFSDFRENNKIKVWNNGRGIPVIEHKTEKMYVPTMIFGHLLTSSNYDDSQKKVTGGFMIREYTMGSLLLYTVKIPILQ